MNRRSALAVLVAILGTGCASTRNIPVDNQALIALRGGNAAAENSLTALE